MAEVLFIIAATVILATMFMLGVREEKDVWEKLRKNNNDSRKSHRDSYP